jgi:hypothetical protein
VPSVTPAPTTTPLPSATPVPGLPNTGVGSSNQNDISWSIIVLVGVFIFSSVLFIITLSSRKI